VHCLRRSFPLCNNLNFRLIYFLSLRDNFPRSKFCVSCVNMQRSTDCVYESNGFLRNVLLIYQISGCHLPAHSNHLFRAEVGDAIRFLFQWVCQVQPHISRVLNKVLIITTTLWGNKINNLNVQSCVTLLRQSPVEIQRTFFDNSNL
jgi:hypothetical protein